MSTVAAGLKRAYLALFLLPWWAVVADIGDKVVLGYDLGEDFCFEQFNEIAFLDSTVNGNAVRFQSFLELKHRHGRNVVIARQPEVVPQLKVLDWESDNGRVLFLVKIILDSQQRVASESVTEEEISNGNINSTFVKRER